MSRAWQVCGHYSQSLPDLDAGQPAVPDRHIRPTRAALLRGSLVPSFIVKKASPGIDALGYLDEAFDADVQIQDFDDSRELSEQAADAHALLVRSVPVTAEVIDAAPNLRLIQRPGLHLEGIDVAYAKRRDVYVCNVPESARKNDAGGNPVSEHSLALILALLKAVRSGRSSFVERRVGVPASVGVAGKHLGLVGLGRIGSSLVPMARALGMRVAAVRSQAVATPHNGLDWVGGPDELHELLSWSDVVSIHLPLTPETSGYVGAAELAAMKKGSYLINTARAEIIDEASLRDAMHVGHLAGFGTDVWWEEPAEPDDPLLEDPRVVATPHIAGMTREGMDAIYSVVAENIRRVQAGEVPLHAV